MATKVTKVNAQHRRIYTVERIKQIRAELQRLKETPKTQPPPSRDDSTAFKMHREWVFRTFRRRELQKELAALLSERRSLGAR
jgi:hypothetical protein